jgi:hypothetical protein
MITMSLRAVARSRAGTRLACSALMCTAVGMTVLVSACGSGGHTGASGPSGASRQAAAAQQTCAQVDAVLSDGPDPGADPLGYAEAQVLPLQQIHAPSPTLSTAISALATDYQSFYVANGAGSTVKADLNSAINRINSLCPGAGATP